MRALLRPSAAMDGLEGPTIAGCGSAAGRDPAAAAWRRPPPAPPRIWEV
eukprot:COSAG01_NODE_27207_length_691_cov_1.822635_1_plen_48_part_10